MSQKKRVFVAGHKGMVGSAICRQLSLDSNVELVVADRSALDLVDQGAVIEFFENSSIDEVYLAAAKVGGIHANNEFPAEFIYQNLQMQLNIIHASYLANVKKLLFLGSSCIYPKFANQPIKEEELLNGALEATNEPYAVAKIAGIKLCESYNRQYGTDYRSIMPTNLYGEGDNFHPENSHVIPAMLQRFHKAKLNGDSEVTVWGTGTPRREFLYVDDMANASIFMMSLDQAQVAQALPNPMLSHVNVGAGVDYSIKEVAEIVKAAVGFEGELAFDASKPDGTPRKWLDVSKMSELGWQAKMGFSDGVSKTYRWYLNNLETART
jgi:GDP-L-fucose synthase